MKLQVAWIECQFIRPKDFYTGETVLYVRQNDNGIYRYIKATVVRHTLKKVCITYNDEITYVSPNKLIKLGYQR